MDYQSKILDHLGLVAAMFDELEIGQQIDRAIPQDFDERIVSIGNAVKAMVLNGLGFVNKRLYLVPLFFETKPTERLIASGIRSEHLNDDTLGRALDSLYDYGVSGLFCDVAAHAAARLGLRPRFGHTDTTSFHLHGQYNSDAEQVDEGVIHIRKGYSRDHRPDLNQAVLAMMVEGKAGLPLLMQPLSGNASDQAELPKLVERHLEQLQLAHGVDYIVADCALYGADHIKQLHGQGVKFITRVPETIKEAQQVIAEADLATLAPLKKADGTLVEGYRFIERHSNYGEVPQRWVLYSSEAARKRAQKRAQKQLQRWREQERKVFSKLRKRRFNCRADAQEALAAFASTLKATRADQVEILECKHYNWPEGRLEPNRVSYCLAGKLTRTDAARAELIMRGSLFIVTTNELDEEGLSAEQLLAAYKGQARVERGFRFLKDPMFLASSLFVRNEKRIMALLMVMTLCLLVYAALEHRIRQELKRAERSFPDQKGKPIQRPTARWVFECFVGIHVLMMGAQELILNLKERHRIILDVLGARYWMFYASPPT